VLASVYLAFQPPGAAKVCASYRASRYFSGK
jgi:hypothetical protein